MGNSTLQAAFKQYRKEGAKAGESPWITAEALLVDEPELVAALARYVREAMRADSELDGEPTAEKPGILATNEQRNSEVEDLGNFRAQKALAEANAGFICGFKTAESNVEDLVEPAHERYFAVLTDQSAGADYHRVQARKLQILYGLYLLRQKTSASTKQTFAEYVQKFLKDTPDLAAGDILQPRPRAAIQAGFGFLVVLLREMKTINNGALLVKSLEHFLQILRTAEPGSFHTGDRLSFVLDSSLNEARNFLVELIEDQGTEHQVAILAHKALFMLALARASVEDLLVLCSALAEGKQGKERAIDLRVELRILRDIEEQQLASISKDAEFDSGEARALRKAAVRMPICNSGGNGVQIRPSTDSWVLEGGFFYALISGRGLVKLQTGSQGGMPGRVVAVNAELNKPSASLMLLGGQLYLRHADIKPAPFMIIDKETLQEVKLEPELKFEPKEGENRSIQWTELNEETGRTLSYTPLITDGTLVYVIARQGLSKAEKEKAVEDATSAPKYVVEVYDPEKSFEFVRAITLYKNTHLEPFVKGSNEGNWVGKAQWATNGSILACFTTDGKARFFSLETGVKVCKKTTGYSDEHLVVYEYSTNQFLALNSQSAAGAQYTAFDFPNFKRPATASSQSGASSQVDELERKYLSEDNAGSATQTALKELNLIEQLMQNVSIADLAQAESQQIAQGGHGGLPSSQIPSLTRSLILRFLSRRCRNFKAHLEVVAQGSERDAAGVMSVFRYPFVTYLTKTTFMELGRGLKACEHVLGPRTKESQPEPHELQSLLFLLELASANFKALNFCSLSLRSLLSKESDYHQFMSIFQSCVGRLSKEAEELSDLQADTSEELKAIWVSIAEASKEIMASSINLLHEGPSAILTELRTALSNGEGQRCQVQVAYLAQIEQLRSLMATDQSEGEQRLQEVLEAFSGIAQLESKIIRADLEHLKLDQADDAVQRKEQADPALSSACQAFLLNFSEEIASLTCALTEQVRRRSQASRLAQSAEEAKVKELEDAKLQAYEKAVCVVAEVSFTELSGHFDFILGELSRACDSKTEEQHWEGAAEKFKKYSTAVSRVLGSHGVFYQVAMLYTQAFSVHRSIGQSVAQAICRGALKAVESVSLLYTIWKKHGEKLGLGEMISDGDSSLVDVTLQQVVAKLRRHLSWYMGHVAYELIKIERKPDEEADKKSDAKEGETEQEKEKKKEEKEERSRKRALSMVGQSNLLSGGIGACHLSIFSKEAKEQLIGYASRMDDHAFLEALNGNQEDGNLSSDEDRVLEAILFAGKDEDTDLTIHYLQRILEAREPRLARQLAANGIQLKQEAASVAQRIRSLPFVTPHAALAGADGLRLSRAAFAVMIKFSDLLDDFTALVDSVAMEASLNEGSPDKDAAVIALITQQTYTYQGAAYRCQPQAETDELEMLNSGYTGIIRRWESAARMRQWINEKKLTLSRRHEKKVADEVHEKKAADKKKVEEEKQKQEAEEETRKTEAAKAQDAEKVGEQAADKEPEKTEKETKPEEDQIDSSSKPKDKDEKANKKQEGDDKEPKSDKQSSKDDKEKAEAEKKEEEEAKLTPEEEVYVADEAYSRLEKELAEIFTKVQEKAQFMTRLNIPLRFKRRDPTRMKDGLLLMLRAPSSFEGLPKPKLDWEARLKSWKQMQTSRGAIKSLTERKAEIWNSGITSILALLQTAVEAEQIQKQVEKTYIDSCRRTAGLKLIRNLVVNEGPIGHLQDVTAWFSAALRCNKNRLTHYLDDAKGQGIHLESQSRKFFFEILSALVQRLKVSKDQKEIKNILNALKWKFTGRDHGDLAELKIFSVLHKGNGEKDNKLRKAWGRKVSAACESLDDQSLSKDVLELFEHLFLAVAGRIVEPDFGGALRLKSSGGAAAPQLQKAKSVIDENASETLLGQAFEVIFREIERYLKIISGFKGVDWGMYVRMRNKERKDEATPQELVNQEDPLLDEVEEEAEDEKEKEDKEKKATNEDKDETKEDGKAADSKIKEEEKKTEAKEASAEKSTEEQKKATTEEVKGAPVEKDTKEDGKADKQEEGEPAGKKTDKEETEEGGEGSGEGSDGADDAEEDGSANGEGEEEATQREEVNTKSKEREERELKQLPRLYSESFLQRLLRLVEIFTSIATCSSHPLSMVQRVANPYHLSSLLNLLLLASPSVKIVVLKVLQHIVRISLPFEVFEEAVRILTRDKNSLAHRILHKIQPSAKFESSMFLRFLFNYLVSLRSKMWSATDAESEGQYAVSQTLSATLRVLSSVHTHISQNAMDGFQVSSKKKKATDGDVEQSSKNRAAQGAGACWSRALKEEITKALIGIETLPIDEADAILSLLPGGEYGGVTAGDHALTSKDQLVTVLGYSTSWKPTQAFFPAGQATAERNTTLKSLRLSPEFTDPAQKAIALFYDKNHQARQDMMQLHPSSLSPVAGLDAEEALSAAKSSPLMDPESVRPLIRLLRMSEKDEQGLSTGQLAQLRLKQSQVLMTFSSQIEVMGKQYIDYLRKEGLLGELMAFLYKDVENTSSRKRGTGSKQVVPVTWLEAKLQRMRKLAIETPHSLSLEKEETQAFLLDKKELIFKRTDPVTKNISRVNAYLTSAVNLHKVAPDTLFKCSRSSELTGLANQSSQAVKNGLVIMPFSELEALSPHALKILHQSDAIMTTQREDLDVKELFKKILDIFKKDQEKKREYSNLLETVIFFVSEEDYERCTRPSSPVALKATSSDANQSQLARLLEDLSEWGGVDKDQILCYLQEGASKDMDAALSQVEEGLIQMQTHEQKYQDDLVKSKKSNDLEAIKKLEVSEEARRTARKEVIEQKRKLLLEASADSEEQKTQGGEGVPVFDAYEKDLTWWKELKDVVVKKFVPKPAADASTDDTAEKTKNDEQMTKLLYSIMTDFDPSQLQFEHAKAVEQMLVEQRKDCLFAIVNSAQQEEVLPGLLGSEDAQSNFSKFLKMQFNSSIIQLLQIGQKKSYQQIKQKLKDIFRFCKNSSELKQFMTTFLLKDILKAGVKTVQDLRIVKIGKVTDYFQVEERAVTGLNPYLLRFMTQYLVKEDALDLINIKNCISTLVNLHICMVLYFQEQKALVRKLLKSCLKLLCFANKHCGALVKAGELSGIVENQLIKLATSQINFKDESQAAADGEGCTKLTSTQLLFLEIHLQVNRIQSKALQSHQAQTIQVLEDSEAICRVKRNKQVLKEADSFDLLRYLYHLEHLDDEQKALMNVTVETSHPSFDAMARALINIPEVQRVKIKLKEATKLKDFTYLGISNSPTSDIVLKSIKDKEFEWASGRFYLFYPVQKQNVIGFGQNGSKQLGEASESFKTPQISVAEAEEGSETFRPARVYGRGEYSAAVTNQGKLYETGSMEGGGAAPGKFTATKAFKEKVRFVAVAKSSVMVVLENNQIFYRGESIDFHFPNDEWKGTFTRLKLWSDPADEQKIVDIASGHGFTLAVTDAGNLWAWGRRFLETVGQEQNTPKQLKLPRGQLCRKVWAAPGVDSPCAFVELEDSESGAKAIYSAGRSEKGLLGQGQNVKESKDFKKIQLGAQDTVFTEFSVGAECVIAIDSEGLLWGWGHNDQHRLGLADVAENGIHRPMKLYSLNLLGLKAKRASCGLVHSLILFEDQQEKQVLYSVGVKMGSEYAHLGVEEDLAGDEEQPFREVKTFSDRNIVDFIAHDQASLVIIGGGDTDVDGLYAHKLPDDKKAKGLLHFYKQDGQWKFVTEEDYADKKADLPDLCFAIKCPIENLTKLEWPDLEALTKEVFEESGSADASGALHEGMNCTTDGQEVRGPLYHSRCFINHEEVEVNHTEKTILEDDSYSVNPLIFFRVARPMKKEAKLPSIDLEKFYKQDSAHGLDLEIVPDLTHQKNEHLIEVTKTVWDEILENDSKFDPTFKEELLAAVDNGIGNIVKEKAINDVNFEKELKMSELKFQERTRTDEEQKLLKGLKKLPEKIKKQKACLYWMLNTFFFKLLPYVTKDTRGIPGTAYELVNSARTSLLSSMKSKYVKEQIEKLPEGSSLGVTIKRAAAQRFADQGKCDHNGEFMIFGQFYQLHKKDDNLKNAFRMNRTDSQMFSVSFAGEGSIDVGGPFRDTLSNIVQELETDALPLLIKTANHRNDHGSSRECFTLNPASITPTHAELFTFMGYFLGFSIRSQSALDWHFPPIFWKQLLGLPVGMADLLGFDAYSWQILTDIKKQGATLAPEAFDAVLSDLLDNASFQTYLSNGSVVDLCPGGKDIAVTHANHKEFIELVTKVKLAECEQQMAWVRQGVSFVLDMSILSFLSWDEVELRACGPKDISTEALKAITDGGDSSNKWVKMFWQMFETLTQEERRKYLKFVWGRSKLPNDTSQLEYRHQICVLSHLRKDALPEAHTCFFQLDIPEYESVEIMGKRFRTAIELCGEIDTDYGAGNIADEDGNRAAGAGDDSDY